VDQPVEEASRKPTVYLVIAYRWGTLNNHNYIVTATTDRAEAIAAAKDECDGRGGKYGVEVVEYPGEDRIAYFSSSGERRDATGPSHSDDLSAAHYIGEQILSAFQNGLRWGPRGQEASTPAGNAGELTQVPAEMPSWIAELCQHALRIHRRST